MIYAPVSALILLGVSGCLIPFLFKGRPLLYASLTAHIAVALLLATSAWHFPTDAAGTIAFGGAYALQGFRADWGPTEVLLAAGFSTVAALILWTSMFTLHKSISAQRIPLFIGMYHLAHLAVLGVVFSTHLFGSFILLELSGFAAALMIVVKDQPSSLKTAQKYLLFTLAGSGLLLAGMTILYSLAGSLDMTELKTLIPTLAAKNKSALLGSLLCVTSGLGIKGALFPLHVWLPDAHSSAPTPASALLSALVIKAPPLLLIKLMASVYGPVLPNSHLFFTALACSASAGILYASLAARTQSHIKRMVAFSSISQVGYIFLGIGLGTAAGTAMALYHMLAHSLAKSIMFLATGAFIEQTGRHDLPDFKGLGKEMPFVMGAFTLSAFSMIGIPILPGFISKFALALAVIEAHRPVYLLVLLSASLLSAYYYLPIVINGYFGEENLLGKIPFSKMKPLPELVPLAALCLLLVAAGLFSGRLMDILLGGMITG